jgi:hypothetical protein
MATALDEIDGYPRIRPQPPAGFRGRRSVHDGYVRGWGLEFGGLAEKIMSDDDYRYALRFAESRAFIAVPRLMNLFLLIKFYLPPLPFGHIIELGSYRCGTAFFMGALAERLLPGVQVYALDTFSGMPETDRSIDAHGAGDFGDADYEEILAARSQFNLANVHPVRGFFSDTAPRVLDEAGAIALAHVDCDIYESVRNSYELCKPRMVPNGYIVFDDSTTSSCIGATEAVEKFVIARDGFLSEQIYPHHVFRISG